MSADRDRRPFSNNRLSDASLTPDLSSPRTRRALVAVGAALIVGGPPVSVVLGSDDGPSGLIATLGLLAAIVGLAYCYGRVETDRRFGSPPPVETRSTVDRAGADFERVVETGYTARTGRAIAGRDAAVGRLRSLAVDRVADRDEGDEATAAEAVRAGTWTDDEAAATLLADGDDPLRSRSRLPFRDATPSLRGRVERALGEVAGPLVDGDWTPTWGPTTGVGSATADWVQGISRTGRWRGLLGLGVATLGVAAITRTAGTALAAALVLGMAGYVRLVDPPTPRLAVERTVDAEDPRPGDPVTVSVAVENVGSSPLVDLRIVDGVPDGLAVVDGSPRHATALRPGERTTFSYDVRAVYGEHEFTDAFALTRDPAGERERATTVETSTATLTCEPGSVQESVPLHPQTTGLTGRVPTDAGGSGTEFHSVRDYRRGDPLRRVDWRRLAKSGELATLEFREEAAATVVVLIDAREAAFRAPTDKALSAVDRSRSGAAQVVETLLSDGDRVGLASVGPEWAWVAPGAGRAHRTELRTAIGRDPAFAAPAGDASFHAGRFLRLLRYRLPAGSQIVCFSPLLDDEVADVLRRLDAYGHPVTVFSPDPTTVETVGGTVARLERARMLDAVRATGIRVVDWKEDEPLAVAVARANARWRR